MPPVASPCPLVIDGNLRIPGISDLASFREWLHSEGFPEKLRVSYLAGLVWLELNWEHDFLERPLVSTKLRAEENRPLTSTVLAPVLVAAPVPVAPAFPPCPIIIDGRLRIPGISDLDSFCRWLHSDEFPEKLRVSFLAGIVWLDLSMEQGYTHNDAKGEVTGILRFLVRSGNLGQYFTDGMRLRHPGVGLSTDPDGIFVSTQTFATNLVHELPNRHGVGVVELEGTPDMVLEIVSDTSVEKDNVTLPPLYQAAGIPEFWRIDARGNLNFEILRLTPTGYSPTRLPDGWWRSEAFQREFRMTVQINQRGRPQFTLEHR